MPQEFQVVRCYDCNIFQVQQKKKLLKWECKMCGKKQSLQKVYGESSTSVDCRRHVQKLNLMHGELHHIDTSPSISVILDVTNAGPEPQGPSKWDIFLDTSEAESGDEEGENKAASTFKPVSFHQNNKLLDSIPGSKISEVRDITELEILPNDKKSSGATYSPKCMCKDKDKNKKQTSHLTVQIKSCSMESQLSPKKPNDNVYSTLSTTDLVAQKSFMNQQSIISLSARMNPEETTDTTDEQIIDPRANLEQTYPLLHKFVNNQLDWNAPLQLLEITLDIINDKRVFRKKTDSSQCEDLKHLYRNWWLLIRNNPSLQNSTVRKLAKYLKDFIVAALEDASHNVKMAILGSEKLTRLSTSGSYRQELDKKSQRISLSQFSHAQSTFVESPSGSSTKSTLPAKFSGSISKFAPSEIKLSVSKSKGMIQMGQQFHSDMSTDIFPTTKGMNEDEMYMQIIVKDILSDISAREAERQKKLIHTSDEGGQRIHRSSAETEHTRIQFGSKRMSGKTIRSRIPLQSIKTSKNVGSIMDNKHASRHSAATGLKNLLETSHLRSELKEKIESIKLRNDRQEISAGEAGVKSIKDKIHLKLRANGTAQMQTYVRPLGKK